MLDSFAQRVAMIFWQYRVGMNAERLIEHFTHDARPIRDVHRLRHHRDAGKLADHVGVREQLVACFDIA